MAKGFTSLQKFFFNSPIQIQERMHGVDKMDIEGNSKGGKLGIWKEEGLWCGGGDGGLTRVENIMVLDWG